jgi:hypothetical protein
MKENITPSLKIDASLGAFRYKTGMVNSSLGSIPFLNTLTSVFFEKCLLCVFTFFLFFSAYSQSCYHLQFSEAYETVSLPDEIKPLASASLAVPTIPKAFCHPQCDPYFKNKYSKKLGFDLSCSFSRDLIMAASKWLGMPHKAKVGEAGIDCSEFVRNVFLEAFGTNLNVCSKEMYTKRSKPITTKQLRQGDLVFFNIAGSDISHVGIYLQDGNFIHTSYSRGVRVSSLKDKYYSERFYAAGRVL